MLVAWGRGDMIPPDRKTVSTMKELLEIARPIIDKNREQIEYLNVIRAMEKIWFGIMHDNLVIIDKYLTAVASHKSQPSVQLKQLLIKLNVECPCKFCVANGQLIACLRDLDHWSEEARQLKAKFGGGSPSDANMAYLTQHLRESALLMPCQCAHRLKDNNMQNLVAAGIIENPISGISLMKLSNIRLVDKLDENTNNNTFRNVHIPLSEKGLKDHHHHTEEYNLGVFVGNDKEFTVSSSCHCLFHLLFLTIFYIHLVRSVYCGQE